ncbi:site-specific DNA-methyltransferase [Mesomycoplasma ovipneumoniae str. Black Butte]|uniref:site-specific DNA-methyltransferase n=1 Tax=Mesomycoplasma ovipneumoniae TaxID=29562 RepID=UPI002FD9A8E8
MNKNIFELVEGALKKNSKYVSDDGKLLKATVYSDVMMMDRELLSLLLSNEEIKQSFFEKVNETLIFDKQKFAWFIESKEFLPDSYTRYTNKIGLTHNGNFISKSNDVVLDFPYKDCVLEGGQDKDEQKRKEIFYNEIIASDAITKMLAPKVFTKAKRYTKDGVEENITFNENDNLIIKGNNLIALSSLLRRYEGKVKCIYIDPPYNTGNDGFNYNDSFNHSTWLTFMKNRLELAKKLLREDGMIFVQCDDNEQAYLKVLMDDIFGRDNFVANIIPLMNPRGRQESSYPIARSHEYIVIYTKIKDNGVFYRFGVDENKSLNDEYRLLLLRKSGNESLKEDRPNMYYPIYFDEKNNKITTSYNPNYIEVFPIKKDGALGRWRWSKENVENNSNLLVCKKNSLGIYDIYVKDYIIKDGMIKGTKTNTFLIDKNIINDKAKEHLKNIFKKDLFNYPKSEFLINRIIEISSNPNDLILDFYLGSGTTAAVAHKMGRRYIGVEQMDYIENITVERIKKVIDGEQGGISKTVNWQGGGSFVYLELLENASTLIKEIQETTEETISEIKNKIYSDERTVPYITREELKKVDEEFNLLELEEKKKALISLVDKNKLYVNYSDMEDESYAVSDKDKIFTKSFYNGV